MEYSREEVIELYDLYGQLLTEKQREYFENYYFLDLSISEIAENCRISRNAVFDQIKRATNQLIEYENVLKINKKIKQIELLNIEKKIKVEIINILMEE
ncbi:MAG: YlxM family DNA-binding protein [Anaeroplasma sp.]